MTTYEDNGSMNMELTEETGAREAAVPMAAAASDRAEYIDAIPREYVEAPYHIAYKGNETVSLNSGALQLSYTDVHLPGLNGFDLDVVRSYDSTASGAQYAIPEKPVEAGTARTSGNIRSCACATCISKARAQSTNSGRATTSRKTITILKT